MYTGEHDSSFISFIISFTFTDRVPIIFRTFIRGIENKEKRGKNNRKAMLCTELVLYIYIYIYTSLTLYRISSWITKDNLSEP